MLALSTYFGTLEQQEQICGMIRGLMYCRWGLLKDFCI